MQAAMGTAACLFSSANIVRALISGFEVELSSLRVAL